MHACDKCSKLCAGLLVVVGVLFLLQDLQIWNFWGISWYTVAFLLFGVGSFGCTTCKDCKAMRK